MKLQQTIAGEVSQRMVGRRLRVLVEKPFAGRSAADAPDVDGQVILTAAAEVGEFRDVLITGTQVYDLLGRPA